MLSSKKQSSFHKRTTFGIFTCCKILLRPETICEMNQKGEENRSQLPLSFLNKKFPEILQRTSFQLGMVVGTVRCLNSGAKKVTCSETCPKGLPLQISFNIPLGKCQESFIRRLWRAMMILALTNDHDFSFPCKWFSFESESGRRRCPCRARVFLGPMPPVIPFKASACCKNSDNLEFCILFPHVNVTKCK